MKDQSWERAAAFMQSQKAALMTKSYAELVALAPYHALEPPDPLRKFRFGVYRDQISNGQVRIVIQAIGDFCSVLAELQRTVS